MSELRLIGTGRSADVFDAGNGRVLRRYRTPHPGKAEREALVMRHLHGHGVPVPEVFDADGDDLVMQRVQGPSMLEDLKRRPWRARRHGRTLAQLQQQVAAAPVPTFALPQFGGGTSILHLDLHPDNVLLSPDGPVIIDWPNAALGEPLADVAYSWTIMATSTVDDVPRPIRPILTRIRRALLDGFVHEAREDPALPHWVDQACGLRLLDPNCRPDEQLRVKAFAAEHGTG